MTWNASVLAYVTATLQQVASEPLALVFAFALGLLSAAASACCTVPALGLLIGYSGASAGRDRAAALRGALAFAGGTVLALLLLGGLAGFVGQFAQSALGRYWKLFAGFLAILFGLATLKLLPFPPSKSLVSGSLERSGKRSTVGAGLLLGGGVAACSLPCNPGMFIILGAAVLQGRVVWAALLLASFAVGFSLPLGVLLFGVGLGKTALLARGADTAVRWASGMILIGAGFYLLST